MKNKYLTQVIILLALLVSFIPGNANAAPPADVFQLPWTQGESWIAMDGFDNGIKRLPTSPHNYKMGGAVDFAPHVGMKIGEDTSNFWVTAAAAGTVFETSSCHIKIDHGNGWTTEYWHLANIQVTKGTYVYRNQRLGVIADSKYEHVCTGNEFPGPHLHFLMRPKMIETVFSGWSIKYNILTNVTTFTKAGQTLGSYQPILNIPNLQIAWRDLIVWNTLYVGSVDPFRYERWTLQLSERTKFTAITNPVTIGLTPLIVLLDSNGNEITRGTGTLTSTQPAGTYFVQIQSQAGSGFYSLLAKKEDLSDLTQTPTPTPTSTSSMTPTPETQTFTPTSTTPTPTSTSMTPTPETQTFTPTSTTPTPTSTSMTPTPETQTFTPTSTTPTPTSTSMTLTPETQTFTPTSTTPTPTSTSMTPTPETQTFTPTSTTPTPTSTSMTPTPETQTSTPTSTTPTPTPTSIPTLLPTDPYVITIIDPASINISEIVSASVNLNNVPVEGYASTEFTCTYNPTLLEVGNIAIANLFGADAAAAINGTQNGIFIVAIAGSNGNKTASSGTAFTFSVRGLQAGQTTLECRARVSKGDSVLSDILFIADSLNIVGSTPTETPTPTPTSLPPSVTVLTGQVLASKPVTIRLYNADNSLAATLVANADGTFNFTAPAGTYTITAAASGFLNAQGSITLTNGITRTMTTVALPAGDIDGNGVIDQFDALTIGMSYNTAIPPAADLNNDGIINVLDLELLAGNYRKSGAVVWQ
jgi:murein DD-endopeptidase MepM/ murein hydrolase activator NlpD